jgi:diguanylate cyclase (GGDEF)-like protein/PAS domain S-box-containing protein
VRNSPGITAATQPLAGVNAPGLSDPRARGSELFHASLARLHRRTDRMFGVLLVLQFFAALGAALWLSPRTWEGDRSSVHPHVWAAVFIGLTLTALPLTLIVLTPGRAVTRHTVAVAQMLFSALLIHLTGGRIETHFHVFGSLAFLAFYRDWKVLVPATLVVAADHLIRGLYWPWSVFGVTAAAPWRALEHAGWVIFEDIFLVFACVHAAREMRAIASAHAELEQARDQTEARVRERTAELEQRTGELRASEERYALAERGTRDGLWDWNLLTGRVYYAPRWKELLGLPNETVGDSPQEWFGRISSGNLGVFHKRLTAHIEGSSERLETELEMNHASGDSRWMLCRSAAIRDARGVAIRLTGSLTDITELKQAQENLRRLAQHDRLTSLPNRALFKDRLRAAMAVPDSRFAVLFFDFDRFKLINDSLGHTVGDALLVSIADRFRRHAREGDTIARFGGDEFMVLLDTVGGRDEAVAACERFLEAFAQPHDIDGRSVVSTASIGLVMSDLGYTDPDEMIRDADVAMYQAKLHGRGTYREFDATMHAEAVDRLNIEQDLRRADIAREFVLFYQPIVSISTGTISGFEALLRWNHPSLGLIGPDSFINPAEETGLIIAIGEWVVGEACRQLAEWRDRYAVSSLTVSVNLSRRQLIDPGLPDRLAAVAGRYAVNPADIRIEIAESDVMDERANIASVLSAIKAKGFGLAMDDFGTGHSSLWCLHKFPLDVLKIDRSFVRHMEMRREFTAVMQAIISLSHNLGLRVVAEGVETPEQLAQLQAMDCDYAQGFLFARAVPADQAVALLRHGMGRRAA